MAVDLPITQLEADDMLRRAERARNALLAAVDRLPEDRFQADDGGEWSVARALRHVVWVEHYWTLIAQRARDAGAAVCEIDESISLETARAASRRAGTPEEALPAPPPYATRDEAMRGMHASRDELVATIQSLTADDLNRRISAPRGVVPFRFAVEHVIEHDWDHAVQITAIAGKAIRKAPR